MQLSKSPTGRSLHGFDRTICGCEFCRIPCRHLPGALDPSDLDRLCPQGQNVFTWAEEHLRALTDRPAPTLVPARQANGHCHWFFRGKCAVHENAPFGCSFFDSHMDKGEARRRAAATIAARRQDAADDGLYYRVWKYLCQSGLIAVPGDRDGWKEEAARVYRSAQRRMSAIANQNSGEPGEKATGEKQMTNDK